MATYRIARQPFYCNAQGILFSIGDTVTLPDTQRPPKGAEPLDEAAEKWCNELDKRSFTKKAELLEAAAAKLREQAEKAGEPKVAEPKPELKAEAKPAHDGAGAAKPHEHAKDAGKVRAADKSPV
jgi:hypothetical protein